MRERGLEFKVGLLIVIALVVLGGFIFVLGNFSLRDGFTVNVLYEFSGNIHPGAPVKVSGIKVGKVQSVDYIGGKQTCARAGAEAGSQGGACRPDGGCDSDLACIAGVCGHPQYVKLEVWIEDRVKDSVKTDAEFYVNTAGVLGEQYLEIVPGHADGHIDSGMTMCGQSPPRTDLIVSRLYDVLEALSRVLKDDREVITRLLTNSASAVTEVNTFLTENRKQMGELLVSANRLAGEASDVLAKVDDGIGDPKVIGRTVRDADALLVSANHSVTTLTPPARDLLVDAKRATGMITEQRLDRALEVADKAVAVAGKAGGLIDNVNGMVTDLRKGKGTAGALLVREEVYADLREMLRDLKRNPWKFFWKE